jgi:DivIVA domain-containing protein
VADDSSQAGGRRQRRERSASVEGQGQGFGELRQYVPAELLDVSFPVSVRGYERRAVDAYVKRVNRAIAELKVSASPPAAVRHALDQAGDKVEGLLRAAREAGAEITASAGQEAEESSARARAEAAELLVDSSAEAERVRAEANELLVKARAEADEAVAAAKGEATTLVSEAGAEARRIVEGSQAEADARLRKLEEELAGLQGRAETRLRELEADTNAIWQQRRELLDNIGAIASGLLDLAETAAERLPLPPTPEVLNAGAGGETEPPTVPTGDIAHLMPAVGLPHGTSEADGERADRGISEPDS